MCTLYAMFIYTITINTLKYFKKNLRIKSAKKGVCKKEYAIKIVMPKNGIFTQFILYLNIIS